MRKVVNANKVLMNKLPYDELETKILKKTLAVEVQKQRKTPIELKVRPMSLKAIENPIEDRLGRYKEQKYVKRNGGSQRYLEMDDSKYAGILNEVKKQLALYTTMEVLQIKVVI